MTAVKIGTTPDASVVQQALAMGPSPGPLAGVIMNGNSWQADLASGNYSFEHRIWGPDQASCGVTVSIGGNLVKTYDKNNHVVSADPGQEGQDMFPFTVVVP